MTRDPILEEVRTIREDIAKEHDYDLDSIFEMFRRDAANSDRAHVNLSASANNHTALAAQLGDAADEPSARR
jgi:hypothetical protein